MGPVAVASIVSAVAPDTGVDEVGDDVGVGDGGSTYSAFASIKPAA